MLYILEKLMRQFFTVGTLRIAIDNHKPLIFKGQKSGKTVEIGLSSKNALRRMVFNPKLQIGQLYMNEELWLIDGTLDDFLCLTYDNCKAWDQHALGKILGIFRKIWSPLKTLNRPLTSKRNVAHHYDLNDKLYDQFLDGWRQYSCAYFNTPETSLDEAQATKLARIDAKLNLEPDLSILDIGSGWGGLAYALTLLEPNIQVKGITLSEQQLAYAENALNFPLPTDMPRPEFQLIDYRSMSETFDRIVSVGMLEHVGQKNFKTYFSKIADCLKPNGSALIHTIVIFNAPRPTNSWIQKYIFPGGYLPSLSQLDQAIEASGLIITDIEVMRLHYATTHHQWRAKFLEDRAAMEELFDARFVRMWEFYLTGSEYLFRSGTGMVLQIQLAHDQEAVPLTRSYIQDKTEIYVKKLWQTQNSGKQQNYRT